MHCLPINSVGALMITMKITWCTLCFLGLPTDGPLHRLHQKAVTWGSDHFSTKTLTDNQLVSCYLPVAYLKNLDMSHPQSPLPANRHHWSNSDCLEGKMKNYQACSVQYCAQQLCIVQCTHIWTDLTVLWIGLVSDIAIFVLKRDVKLQLTNSGLGFVSLGPFHCA